MNIEVGCKFEIEYPFYNYSYGIFNNIEEVHSIPGCHRVEIEEENIFGGESTYIEWVANSIGSICYEVMAIAEMPGKYMDRVIIKYHYLLPSGDAATKGKMKTLTTGKLKSQISSGKVFPCEYEEDEHYKSEIKYSDKF